MIEQQVNSRERLMVPDSRGVCVRVDIAAIAHNARALKSTLNAHTRMMAVVKANAYGHGLVQVARAAVDNGADYLGVAVPEEGAVLRAAGIEVPCLVLGNVSERGAYIAAQAQLTQTVCDVQGVWQVQQACEALDCEAQVHLKVDTGMSRIGARTPEEIAQVLSALQRADKVRLTGAFTHFADAADDGSVRTQLERFKTLASHLPNGILLHAAASGAALKYPCTHLDMVRTGIALYGCEGANVQPAMQWETRVAYVKDIRAGDAVSYGGDFRADKPMRIATIAIGYGDGYSRACSGKASVLIHGRRCRVLGRVCMDQTMVDVTHVPDVCAGDTVVLLGKQQDDCITAQEVAAWADTISYEVLLWHGDRVPVIFENN